MSDPAAAPQWAVPRPGRFGFSSASPTPAGDRRSSVELKADDIRGVLGLRLGEAVEGQLVDQPGAGEAAGLQVRLGGAAGALLRCGLSGRPGPGLDLINLLRRPGFRRCCGGRGWRRIRSRVVDRFAPSGRPDDAEHDRDRAEDGAGLTRNQSGVTICTARRSSSASPSATTTTYTANAAVEPMTACRTVGPSATRASTAAAAATAAAKNDLAVTSPYGAMPVSQYNCTKRTKVTAISETFQASPAPAIPWLGIVRNGQLGSRRADR